MIPCTFTVANGDQVRLPGGNMLWVYELEATSGVTGKFYAPDGKQIGTEWTLKQGVKYGPGKARPDGSFFFQWVDVYNNSGSSQTFTFYVLESFIDLSGAASLVSINDTYLDASSRQGMLELQRSLAPEAQLAAHESIDFSVHYTHNAVSFDEWLSLLFIAEAGGSANYPHMIFIDRIEYQADGKCVLGVDEGVTARSSVSPVSGHAYISTANFHAYNGGAYDNVFPTGGGATRRWVQYDKLTASLTSSEWVDGFEAAAGQRHVWEPPVPLCVAAYDPADTHGSIGVYLDNLEASGTNKLWMRVYGRVVPTDTGWT